MYFLLYQFLSRSDLWLPESMHCLDRLQVACSGLLEGRHVEGHLTRGLKCAHTASIHTMSYTLACIHTCILTLCKLHSLIHYIHMYELTSLQALMLTHNEDWASRPPILEWMDGGVFMK